MAFKRRPAVQAEQFDDPVDLYLRLSERGGPGPIWDHQGQVLRSWNSQAYRDAADVALELPTGAGKTLVAGLIGEFQRRTAGDRVAYLCLTRQLAGQTARRLDEYGIPNVLLTGAGALVERVRPGALPVERGGGSQHVLARLQHQPRPG
jgi:superfamily II DNA or RNA helicase